MWKKHGTALLGLVLTVALLLTGVKLPDNVLAEGGADKTGLVQGKETTKIEFRQSRMSNTEYGNWKKVYDKIITDESKINMDDDILINVVFEAVFNTKLDSSQRIEKGDYVELNLAENLRFTGDDWSSNVVSVPVYDDETTLKTCDAIFTRNPSTGNITVKFDFSTGDDEIFKKHGGKISASMFVKADGNTIDFETTQTTIRLLNKEYEVYNIDDAVFTTKEGKLDAKHGKIDWTITIERVVNGTNPKKFLSLEGYSVRDSLENIIKNEYIPGTFKIGGNLIDKPGKYFYPGDKIKNKSTYQYINYQITADDLDPSNKGSVVVTLSTKVDFSDKDQEYKNKVTVSYNSGLQSEKDATVPVPKFGEKTGIIDDTGKNITWTMDFNLQNYELGDVTLADSLTSDNTGRIPQTFKKAYIQRYSSGTPGAKEEIIPEISEDVHTFKIPDVKERILLTIETEIEPDNYKADFSNDALIYWDNSDEYKAKLHADIFTKPVGGIVYGSISKSAEVQTLLEKDAPYKGSVGDYIGPEPLWTVNADKDALKAPGNYYMYDVFIFDQSVNPNKAEIKPEKDYSIRKVGDSTVTTLANGGEFNSVIPQKGKHQKLSDINHPIIDSTEGVTNSVYEIVKAGKVVGHILEIKLVAGKDNYAKFKSKIMDIETIMQWGVSGASESGYNTIVLTKDRSVVLRTFAHYKYHAKIFSKQTISAPVAEQFLKDLKAEKTNADTFDEVGKSAIDNSKTAFNRKTRTVIFKINVNAIGIKDTDGDLRQFILDDTSLNNFDNNGNWLNDFKFVPIIEDAAHPEENRDFLIYRGEVALKYKDSNEPDYRFEDSTVKAVGNYLSDEEMAKEGITVNPDWKPSQGIRIAFNKLDKPYVVFVKVQIPEDTIINGKGNVTNFARFKSVLLPERHLTGQPSADYDLRFLWKGYEGDKVFIDDSGYIKWNLYYRPYKTYEDGNLTKIRLEDKLNGNLVLRKVKNSDKLIFEGDNYRIFKGEVDNEGNFISQSEITKELDKIFVYDEENGILKIMIPDNNSTYRISYITDFADDAKRGDSLSNEVSLIEDSKLIGKKVVVSHEISASAFAHIHDKPYERLKLIKTDKSGKKLAGAKFSFKKLKTEGSAEEDKGIFTSVSDSAIIIDDLTEGEYELREIEAPEGYETNDVTYKISVVELESGFKVDLIGDYTGKATLEHNNLTIINKKIDKINERLKIVKTDASGELLEGAQFNLKKVGATTDSTVVVGNYTSATYEAIRIEGLTAGDYELLETKAPLGYELSTEVFKIKVIEVPGGFKAELVGSYEGRASLSKNEITIINKKKPEAPPSPVPPTPVIPSTPIIPSYPENNTPDPNDPNSPDEFELIGKDGTPKGKVIKKTKPNGENEYVFTEDGTPLNGFKVKKKNPILPSTGGADTVWYYATGAGLILMACFVFRKRKEVGKL